jgi:hypothetical protein
VLAAVVVFVGAWFILRPPTQLPQAEVPKLSPAGGQYSSRQTVSITDATPNAVIHYTVDGTPPTQTSPIYVDPLDSLPNGTTLRAMALAPGHRQSSSVIGLYLWSGATADEETKKTAEDETTKTTHPERPNSQPTTPTVYAQGKFAFDHKQYAEARALFEQSCANGNLGGCNYLGYLLSQGLGGTAEVDRARGVFSKACQGGIVNSCISLGSVYQNAGDSMNARKYFKLACDKGNSQACGLMSNVQ